LTPTPSFLRSDGHTAPLRRFLAGCGPPTASPLEPVYKLLARWHSIDPVRRKLNRQDAKTPRRKVWAALRPFNFLAS
jgi:hypothetical protein